MKILNLLSWFAKWKFVPQKPLLTKVLDAVKTVVSEQFLAQQLASYDRAKQIIRYITIALGIAIGVVVLLLLTILVLVIVQLAK